MDSKGVIKVDGLQDMVATLTEEERSRYASIDFSTDEMKANAGADHALHEDKVDMLMSVWRYPSLSIHGDFNDCTLLSYVYEQSSRY